MPTCSVQMRVCQLLSAGANWLALSHRDHLAAALRWYDRHSSAVTNTHTHNSPEHKQRTLRVYTSVSPLLHHRNLCHGRSISCFTRHTQGEERPSTTNVLRQGIEGGGRGRDSPKFGSWRELVGGSLFLFQMLWKRMDCLYDYIVRDSSSLQTPSVWIEMEMQTTDY